MPLNNNQKKQNLLRSSRARGRIAVLSAAAAAGLPLVGSALPAFGQITITFNSSNPDDTINTPQTGTYTFQVYGAEGGSDFAADTFGADGAEVQGNYNFVNRNLLQIYIGETGSAAVADGFGGGGGGGTFVYDSQASFLMAVAGGGGGAGVGVTGLPGQAGTAGTAGQNSGAGAGGTGGDGGQAASAFNNAAGGAGGGGYLTAGATATYFSTSANGGGAYPGLAGGTVDYDAGSYPSGGFGGGGGGLAGGGGGGGYSGGGGGTGEGGGGGGGSYLDSGFTSTTLSTGSGENGPGLVVITPSTSNMTIQFTGAGHIGGNISGAGAVNMAGSSTGTCYLTGIDTYGGGTTVSSGSLVVGDGNNYGSLSSNVNMTGGTFAFDRNDTYTFASNISGSTGTLTQIGTGTTILTGTDSYTGQTTISAGTLQLGNGGSSGILSGSITDNSALVNDVSISETYAGVISGSGSFTTAGGSVLYLTKQQTYTGATTIENLAIVEEVANALPASTNLYLSSDFTSDGGSLILNGSVSNPAQTVASLSGDSGEVGLGTNGIFTVNQSINTVFGGQILDAGGGSTGQLVKQGSGTLVLTGANIYGGGTTISAGALQFGNGGSVTGTITDNASLIFDRSDTVTVGNLIQGFGSVTQAGTGTVTLTAFNEYTGATNVSAGKLVIDDTEGLASAPVSITGGVLQFAPGTGAEFAPGLTITGAGQLDITNNHLYIYDTPGSDPIATIAGYLKTGFNNGNWNGPGIISSTAQTPTNGLRYGVGFADGADGIASGLGTNQIELKYTLLGDANLDGTVNGSDFSILASNFGKGYTNWDQGDFLFTTAINGSDFTALAANFGQGDNGADAGITQSDIAALDAFAIANGLPVPTIATVPEPASALLAVAFAAGALARRQRGKCSKIYAPGIT